MSMYVKLQTSRRFASSSMAHGPGSRRHDPSARRWRAKVHDSNYSQPPTARSSMNLFECEDRNQVIAAISHQTSRYNSIPALIR